MFDRASIVIATIVAAFAGVGSYLTGTKFTDWVLFSIVGFLPMLFTIGNLGIIYANFTQKGPSSAIFSGCMMPVFGGGALLVIPLELSWVTIGIVVMCLMFIEVAACVSDAWACRQRDRQQPTTH